MRLLFVVLLSLLGTCLCVATQGSLRVAKSSSHVFHSTAHLAARPTVKPGKRAVGDRSHTVVFAVKQRNLDALEAAALAVSDPQSPQYGQHWTREQVGALTANREASDAVLAFLTRSHSGATVVRRSQFDEFLEVRAPLRVWESVLDTQFFEWKHADWKFKTIVRAKEYSLPAEIAQHVAHVGHVVDFPTRHHGELVKEKVTEETLRSLSNPIKPRVDNGALYNSFVTPARIRTVYNVFNGTGNARTSQAVYSTIGQTLSTDDLRAFQTRFGTPLQPIAKAYHGYVNATCAQNIDDCTEANLDFQYLMSTAQNIPTISYYDDYESWSAWLVEVSSWAQSEIPAVISMSYGALEAYIDSATISAFSTESAKLAVQGVTLVVATGDDGAPGFGVDEGLLPCGYYADFPSTVPYWTAVGGTMGPESGNPEITCSSASGGGITSGGGFSRSYARPSWQASQVASYLTLASSSSLTKPAPGYGSGRAYPDVSLLANRYLVVLNGSLYSVGGTSASAPVFAGMVSLLNAARANVGLPRMGWINPFLYDKAALFVNDVVSGHNKCTRDATKCCTQGFTALRGWDAATGLGSVDYSKFFAAAVTNFNVSSPSLSPTKTPSRAPTAGATAVPTRSLTNVPTKRPTIKPSVRPTVKPTLRPTQRPTVKPTVKATAKVTAKPTAKATLAGSTKKPTTKPTVKPTVKVTLAAGSTKRPTRKPTRTPTIALAA